MILLRAGGHECVRPLLQPTWQTTDRVSSPFPIGHRGQLLCNFLLSYRTVIGGRRRLLAGQKGTAMVTEEAVMPSRCAATAFEVKAGIHGGWRF
jgi:hypothetical protein